MAKILRVYWDACTWIAYISAESVTLKDGTKENRKLMCRSILEQAEKGIIEIATSAFTLAEVCKSPDVQSSSTENLPAFFDKSYILIVPVDKFVGSKAQALQFSGISGLKPPDAVHLASAYVSRASEMHTFDRKLLGLDKKIDKRDGGVLSINKPTQNFKGTPLLEGK